MLVLVTGAAGFIGYHLSKRLLENALHVIGVDNLNDYYDSNLKKDRLEILSEFDNFEFHCIDIKNKLDVDEIFNKYQPTHVINLAAQAGVRYSIENPNAYIESNIVGFFNILEACRFNSIEHLIYASSSSVYGGNKTVPFSTNHNVDHPVSLYAATKKSNELMAHAYSHLYKIPTTGLRFFTVYGPYGRPDMAYYSFTKKIFEGKKIEVFNNGDMVRDFTFIDDIVESIFRLLKIIPKIDENWLEKDGDLSSSFAPYKIYNIGNSKPVRLLTFIEVLESLIDNKANIEFLEMQDGDVQNTYADVSDLEDSINFAPQTDLQTGLEKFVNWYREYYKINN